MGTQLKHDYSITNSIQKLNEKIFLVVSRKTLNTNTGLLCEESIFNGRECLAHGKLFSRSTGDRTNLESSLQTEGFPITIVDPQYMGTSCR